jgi:hypothetical protein
MVLSRIADSNLLARLSESRALGVYHADLPAVARRFRLVARGQSGRVLDYRDLDLRSLARN